MKYRDKSMVYKATSYMIFPFICAFIVILLIQVFQKEPIDNTYMCKIALATVVLTFGELIKPVVLYFEAKIDVSRADKEQDGQRLGLKKEYAEECANKGYRCFAGINQEKKTILLIKRISEGFIISIYTLTLAFFVLHPFLQLESFFSSFKTSNIFSILSFLFFMISIVINTRVSAVTQNLLIEAALKRAETEKIFGE